MSPKLKKLGMITCTSSDCQNGLHCFNATQEMRNRNQQGYCRSCGETFVDWNRVHRRNLADIAHTVLALKKEMVRHHYWCVEIDQRAVNHALRKGRQGMREATYQRIRTSIGPANPYRDGAQTRKQGNSIYYAQHATACCCRKCAEYWHGVPRGRDLQDAEIAYFSELCIYYIDERLPNLTQHGEKVPRIRDLKELSPS